MISTKPSIRRLATGVPGLDEVLGGGLPEFSFNLIAGPPGCGKTTLAHQIMFALATPEQPALYFTMLGEPPLKMLRYQQQFDFFDLDKLNRSIRFVNLADEFKAGNLDKVRERIVAEVEARAPGLVFIESFSTVAMQGQSQRRPLVDLQHFIHDLGVLLTSWQATTFLIGEYFSDTVPNPVFTVCDGLIWLAAERRAQFGGAQDGGDEDARPGHVAGAAQLSHQPRRPACVRAAAAHQPRGNALDGKTR